MLLTGAHADIVNCRDGNAVAFRENPKFGGPIRADLLDLLLAEFAPYAPVPTFVMPRAEGSSRGSLLLSLAHSV
jgi:hypothetical protein